MAPKEPWGAKLPELPEGLGFEIEVVPYGTYVRVTKVAIYAFTGAPVIEQFVQVVPNQPRDLYLQKIWHTCRHLANTLRDQSEHKDWIREVWGLAV